MEDRMMAWKEAGWVFLFSRLMILLITVFAVAMIPPSGQIASVNCAASTQPCLLSWYHLDAVIYVNIAHHGYTFIPDTAFFPLWPLLQHVGGLLLGGSFPDSYYIAGIVLANICFYFVLVLFYKLLAQDFEASIARIALYMMAFYPYALFFFAGYTEPLFLLLTLALFLVLRRGKAFDWWLAGLFGLLAAATRTTGILLAIPFLVVYIQRFWMPAQRSEHSWGEKINALLPIALIPLGLVAYMIFLYVTKGNALIFIQQESNFGWHRNLSFPWAGIFSAIGVLIRGHISNAAYVQNTADLTFTLFPLAVLAIGWKRIPLHYALFALGAALFTLSFPQQIEPLTSQPRYMLVLFPMFAVLALWRKRQRSQQWILAILSLALLTINIVLFVSHYWVA